jgi:type II secretory pathway pseudopilin PulG
MLLKLIKRHSGMTLIEAVVVIGLYTLLSALIMGTIADFYKFNAYSLEQVDEIENARRGMTQWNRDAKEMTTGEDGSFPIAVIDEHRFGYYSDTDQDDMVEYVEYVLSTTTLKKYNYNPSGTPVSYNLTTPDTEQTLSLYVQNINQGTSTFMYFDNAGNRLSSTSPVINVRYIQAQMIVNIDQNRSPGEFMLRSSIAPRNLKDNL